MNTSCMDNKPASLLPLTDRQKEVLILVARNYKNEAIAHELSIAVKTVEKHRQSAMDKIEANTGIAVAHWAIAEGLVKPMDILTV